jgi:anti-sigma B factor antagonist
VPTPGDTYLPNWAVVMLSDAAIAGGMAELRWELRDLILAGARNVVVDVSQVEELSSTALAALLSTHRACRARGGGVIIRNPNRRARDLLQHTGLHRVFLVEDAEAGDRSESGQPAEAATND